MLRTDCWNQVVVKGATAKVQLGGAHGLLEMHSVCLKSGEQAVVMAKSAEGPTLRLCRVTAAQPHVRVNTRLMEDMQFTCEGGEAVLTGVLRGRSGEKADKSEAAVKRALSPEKVPEQAAKKAKIDAATVPKAAAAPKAAEPKAAAPKAEPKAVLKAEPKAVAKAEAKAEPKAQAKADPKAKAAPKADTKAKKVMLPGGLSYELLRAGSGVPAQAGRQVQVRYEGRLAKNGKQFDKGSIKFGLGAGDVIQGWDEGVKGMLRGEQRRLLIPASMGYGSRGAPPDIPANADLVFEVELMNIR